MNAKVTHKTKEIQIPVCDIGPTSFSLEITNMIFDLSNLLDFRDSCFASTQCKVHSPGEGWSLAPFCGQSKCVKLESGRLAEEVTDCGPVVDLEATPGCRLVKDGADPKADFPACCPVYDCDEGTEVKYVKTPAQKKKEAAAAAAAAAQES